MKKSKEYHQQKEPSISIFILGIILAASISAVVSTYLLSTSPILIAVIVGGIGGLIGVFLLENIGEAIVMSVIIAFIIVMMIKFIPGLLMLKKFVVPALVGLCSGKLVVGIWKELALK